MDEEKLIKCIVQCCYNVRGILSSGYLESVYKKALIHELSSMGIKAVEEYPIKVKYKDIEVGDFRADILVEDRVIVELKAVTALNTSHEAQVVNYLTATGFDNGILVNFGSEKIDIRRKFRVYKPKEI